MNSKWAYAFMAAAVAAIFATPSAQANPPPFSRTLACSSWTGMGPTPNVYSCTTSAVLPTSSRITLQSINASCPYASGWGGAYIQGLGVTVNTVIGGAATAQTIPSTGTTVETAAGATIVVASTATNYADPGSKVTVTFVAQLESAPTSFGTCSVVLVGAL